MNWNYRIRQERIFFRNRIGTLFLLFICGAFISLQAADTDVKINEVRIQEILNPQGGLLLAFAELYNVGADTILLEDWILSNNAGATIAILPDWYLPPKSFLHVYFGNGYNDSIFVLNSAQYFTQGDSTEIFSGSDGLGLYNGSVIQANIIDFVAWSDTSGAANGVTYDHAVAAGIWPSGEYFDITSYSSLATIGLCPDGFDLDHAASWREFEWGIYFIGAASGPANPINIYPRNGATLDHIPKSALIWASIEDADSFQVTVDDQLNFLTPEMQSTTTDTFIHIDPGLPFGFYYWRVDVYHDSNLWSGPSWSFGHQPDSINTAQHDFNFIYKYKIVPNFKRLIQHKDSRMLCVLNYDRQRWPLNTSTITRPGCFFIHLPFLSGPWNGEHLQTEEHVDHCEHCKWYCTRASIAMINRRYGGNLSQDRVSYELFKDGFPSADGDLGHSSGTWLAQRWPVYAWSLNLAMGDITRPVNAAAVAPNWNKPSWATITTEIDAGRPIFVDGRNHATVLAGYRERTPLFGNPVREVIIADPWPGTPLIRNYDTWTPDNWGWRPALLPDGTVAYWPSVFLIDPAAAPAGQMQEAGLKITDDLDKDGILDFDETQRFCSNVGGEDFCLDPNDTDTDNDDEKDINDIMTYVFHLVHDGHNAATNDPLGFPDIDTDQRRAEIDCDSDNDDDFDGGEDIDGFGFNKHGPEETCVFDNTEALLGISTDKFAYTPAENVILFGRTFHMNTTYHYDIIPVGSITPNPLADSTPILHLGPVVTDEDGDIQPVNLGRFPPGIYLVIVDVKHDNYYTTHCEDPFWFFRVEETWMISGEPESEFLYLVDTSDFSTIQQISYVYSDTITGTNALDVDPCTGEVYTVLNTSYQTGQLLATIDTATGDVSTIGFLGDEFSGITFAPDGTLYGVTGDGAFSPSTLYQIDPFTADTTFINQLTDGGTGECIGFCSDNTLIYHLSGTDSATVFESVDPATGVVSNVPLAFPLYDQVLDLQYIGNGVFWATVASGLEVLEIDTSGNVQYTSHVTWPHVYSGIAFPVMPVEAEFNPIIPGFTTVIDSPEVFFSDMTSGNVTGWNWDFGDGTGSTAQNPSHIYTEPGTYLVDLVVESPNCAEQAELQSPLDLNCDPPILLADEVSWFCGRSEVTFDVEIEGLECDENYELFIDFGDGSTADSCNPTHIYDSAGTYTIEVIVTNFCGSDSLLLPMTITCPDPTVDFIFNRTGLEVDFFDVSTGISLDSWTWSYGDGDSSFVRSPSHTYATDGDYEVCLTVTDSCGENTQCHNVKVAECLVVKSTLDYGQKTLRWSADCAKPGNIIGFDPVINGQTITLTSDEILINKNLAIMALPDDSIRVFANGIDRIFSIDSVTAFIQGLNLTTGLSSEASGIDNSGGNLTLKDVIFIANPAATGNETILRNRNSGTTNIQGNTNLKKQE